MSDERARVPDLLLERYRLGELTADEREVVERVVKEEPEARERLRQLETSDLEIRGQHSRSSGRRRRAARRSRTALAPEPAT